MGPSLASYFGVFHRLLATRLKEAIGAMPAQLRRIAGELKVRPGLTARRGRVPAGITAHPPPVMPQADSAAPTAAPACSQADGGSSRGWHCLHHWQSGAAAPCRQPSRRQGSVRLPASPLPGRGQTFVAGPAVPRGNHASGGL